MSIIFNILTVLSALLTAFLYWVGLDRFYFWYYPWFDIPIHMVGGLTIGFWGLALATRRQFSFRRTFVCVLLLAIAVGSVWELFEYVSGLTEGEDGYWFDTLKDLGDDLFGAFVAFGVYWFASRSKKS
ncbi:MAG: hypothetical protein G01um101456_157 [Parcubacteria group bacterium Gr01-1014_56]|nr:MAG: hypothetical protein G01um101456_157 [Parcubacteria group bacterium Gr01-1014_56]